MSTWTARRLAWAIGVMSLVLMVVTLVLLFVDREASLPSNVGAWTASNVFDLVVLLGVPILGIVIVTKQPKNAIGWLFLLAGVSLALATFGQAYALHVLIAQPGALPGGRVLAWLSNAAWPIPIACLVLVFLLFPTGHLVSPRWRVVAWLTVAILALLMAGSMILATASWSDPFEGINIQAGAWSDAARVAIVIAALAEIVALLLSVVSVAVRYRRSSGAERQQLKWFVSAAVVTGVTFSLGFFSDNAVISAITSLALLGLWVAIGIAMVKHNLYDIDVILNKTIAYGALAVIITAVYVVVVVVIGAFIGVTEGLSLVATAVVAVAFQPIWRRAQHFANRLVYGGARDAYEVLSAFSEQVGETYSGEDILLRMVRLLGRGDRSDLRGRVAEGRRRSTAPSPPGRRAGCRPRCEPTRANARVRRTRQPPYRSSIAESELGMLTVVKPPNEPLTPVERTLVTDLAGQAALLLYNSALVRGSARIAAAAGGRSGRGAEAPRTQPPRRRAAAAGRTRRPGADGGEPRWNGSQPTARAAAPGTEGIQDTLEDLRDLARGIYPAACRQGAPSGPRGAIAEGADAM